MVFCRGFSLPYQIQYTTTAITGTATIAPIIAQRFNFFAGGSTLSLVGASLPRNPRARTTRAYGGWDWPPPLP